MFDTLRIMLSRRREFRRNIRMDADQYAAMKLAKFRNLVAHAVEHSAYYQDVVHEHGINPQDCRPQDFPVLTKKQLMADFDRIVTDQRITREAIAGFLTRSVNPADLYLDHFRVIHTSGSSGEMGYFVYSPQDWIRGTSMMMRPRLPGTPVFRRDRRTRRGRIRVAYYAAIGGHFAGVTMLSAMQKGLTRFFVNAQLYEVNEPMAGTVARLNDFQPDVLTGYTGALMLLARQQQSGNLRISPRYINTAGEGMSKIEKAILESVFGGRAGNGYGSSEHLMMGAEVPGGSTMLLFDDDLIYDLKPDCTLVTNLFNYTLPLINYRMSDILRPVKVRTFPELPYPEIEALIGRTETMPVFVNADGIEDSIHPITIAEIFVAGVQRFQLRWLSSTSFQFLVCLDPELDAPGREKALTAMESRLHELLVQKALTNVGFEVKAVETLAVNTGTRKFQLIVDDRKTGV